MPTVRRTRGRVRGARRGSFEWDMAEMSCTRDGRSSRSRSGKSFLQRGDRRYFWKLAFFGWRAKMTRAWGTPSKHWGVVEFRSRNWIARHSKEDTRKSDWKRSSAESWKQIAEC